MQRRIACEQPVQQEVLVKLAQGGKLARYGAVSHAIGKQLAQEAAHIFPPRLQQVAPAIVHELGKLDQVGAIGRNRERSHAFLDSQIVKKAANRSLVTRVHPLSILISETISLAILLTDEVREKKLHYPPTTPNAESPIPPCGRAGEAPALPPHRVSRDFCAVDLSRVYA